MDATGKELLGIFLEECLPLSELCLLQTLTLERLWKVGAPAEETLATIASSLHTLKGNSGMMGLNSLMTFTHHVEDVVQDAKNLSKTRNAFTANLLINSLKQIVATLQGLAKDAEFEVTLDPQSLQRAHKEAHEKRVLTKERRSGKEFRSKGDRRMRSERREVPPEIPEMVYIHQSDTIRVHFEQLDLLQDALGEAMITHSHLLEMAREENSMTLQRTVSLGKMLKLLQQDLMRLRLVPVATVLDRFHTMVRDLSVTLGKKAKLNIIGGDTKVDKKILDKLAEPLLHLFRNALDHGLENPGERRQKGKPEEGTIHIRVQNDGNKIVVEISDDGVGLKLEKIKNKLHSLGISTEGKSDRELYQYVFQPGFSTASQVTQISGRGVGMDVVADTVESLGGRIEVETALDFGSTFKMVFPPSISVMNSLLVEIAQEKFALPMNIVLEGAEIRGAELQTCENKKMFKWRGDLIPADDGNEIIGKPSSLTDKKYVVILAMGTKKRALLVDRLLRKQNIIVKNNADDFLNHPIISGTTIIGTGEVVFILDPLRLA